MFMLDISKTFDTVMRFELMELRTTQVLNEDELHIMKLLIEDVKLTERGSGRNYYCQHKNNIGVPQGYSSCQIIFIKYM